MTRTTPELKNNLTSPTMLAVLRKAASRERGNICPTLGLRAGAQFVVLKALDRRNLIVWDGGEPFKGAPRISPLGRDVVSAS